MAALVSVEIRGDAVALVRLEDKAAKFNTLSQPAVDELADAFAELEARAEGLRGVVLTGKPGGGLGAGANIGELMSFSEAELRHLIGSGHRLLNRIEDFPRPVVACLGNLALGGIWSWGSRRRPASSMPPGRSAFPRSTCSCSPASSAACAQRGWPASATRQSPRRPAPCRWCWEARTSRPGRRWRRASWTRSCRPEPMPSRRQPDWRWTWPPAHGCPGRRDPFTRVEAEAAAAAFRPGLERSTKGRGRPHAGFVFLDLLPGILTLPRAEAQELEMGAFCALTLGPEGKAGMRFFFANTAAGRPPKALQGVRPREIKRIGIAGIDGYMGNAIAWLALTHARLEVVAWTVESAPNIDRTGAERLQCGLDGLEVKYRAPVRQGILTEDAARAAVGRVQATTDLGVLAACDFVVEAIAENASSKLEFFEQLGRLVRPGTVVASNSSSMGPGFLAQAFEKGGGRAEDFLNLHFFSPAELSAMALTELIASDRTSPEALATAFALARSMKKTPVLLRDGSRGFFVNAVLAGYLAEAEALLEEGTPVEALDAALMAAGMPQGYATLLDAVGLDTCAGMLRFMGHERSVLYRLVEAGRLGKKSGGGFYDYEGTGARAAAGGVWSGLQGLMSGLGTKTASAEEIVERCFRAMYETARELLERGIVDSRETADLAMILGLGFPVYLGGIFFYAEQRGWDR